MYALTPTKTSTPSSDNNQHSAFTRYNKLSSREVTPPKNNLSPSRNNNNLSPPRNNTTSPPSKSVLPPPRDDLEIKKTVYFPSKDQPYATYVRTKRDNLTKPEPVKTLADSRVSILEKQLEYMRRLVHNAESERTKATEKLAQLEGKENKETCTLEDIRKQNEKIEHLQKECERLNSAHSNAQDKIKELEGRFGEEKDSHEKLFRQTEENSQLARLTEENKNLMLSITPSLPPSPPNHRPSPSGNYRPSPEPKRKQRSTRSGSYEPKPPRCETLQKPMPFVCGRSAHPSHSLSANVQQV
eukprot:sb/3467398/